METSTTRHRNLISIDILRGLATLAVLMVHTNLWLWKEPLGFFNGKAAQLLAEGPLVKILYLVLFGFGFLGVPLFFVISGFCIHLPYANPQKKLLLKPFFIRRFMRLYPLYILVTIESFILYGFYHGFGHDPCTIQNFIGHLFFWHFFSKGLGMGIEGVMWTLAVEVQFYILYCLTLPLLRRYGLANVTTIALIIDVVYRLVYKFYFHQFDLPIIMTPERFFLIRYGEWLLGACLAEQFVQNKAFTITALKPIRNRIILAIGLLASGAVIGISLKLSQHESLDVLASLAFFLIISALIQQEKQLGDHERSNVMKNVWLSFLAWAGVRSYSLYLVHAQILWFSHSFGRRLYEKLAPLLHTQIDFSKALGVLIGIGVSLLVAQICYRLIEAPSHKLARLWSQPVATEKPAV